MQQSTEVVKDSHDGEWEVTITLPESIDEAREIYGDDGVLTLFNAGLKVKLQAIARNGFKRGETREAVEAAMAEYKPGRSSRRSKKRMAFELVAQNGAMLLENPDLYQQVNDAIYNNKWDTVIELIGG